MRRDLIGIALRGAEPELSPTAAASGLICCRQPYQNSGNPCSRTISGPSPALHVVQSLVADLGVAFTKFA